MVRASAANRVTRREERHGDRKSVGEHSGVIYILHAVQTSGTDGTRTSVNERCEHAVSTTQTQASGPPRRVNKIIKTQRK